MFLFSASKGLRVMPNFCQTLLLFSSTTPTLPRPLHLTPWYTSLSITPHSLVHCLLHYTSLLRIQPHQLCLTPWYTSFSTTPTLPPPLHLRCLIHLTPWYTASFTFFMLCSTNFIAHSVGSLLVTIMLTAYRLCSFVSSWSALMRLRLSSTMTVSSVTNRTCIWYVSNLPPPQNCQLCLTP